MSIVAPAKRNEVERILPDQLVVATPYASAVIDKLNSDTFKMRVGVEHSEECVPLGLTRIKFEGPYRDGIKPELVDDDGVLKIGAVLVKLRAEFGEENAGWYPTMGKNRALADNIIGGGSMIYKGVGEPAVIPERDLPVVAEKWSGAGRPDEPGGGVRVGIVDTRVLKVPPLAGALRCKAHDMLRMDEVATRAGHATFVAGLILSVAPGVELIVRGILDNNGVSDSWEAAKAIVEIGNRVDILNLSFGCHDR